MSAHKGEGETSRDVTGSVRLCDWCRASIAHKRANARFCYDSHRVMFVLAAR
jgi:hypothetical protein